MNNVEELRELILEKHKDAFKQQEVIFSESPRILVEAPAGYGKTHTMISKIAYSIASNQVTGFKKILALTFSVNAAHKIKRDVAEQLPILLKGTTNIASNKVFATNYHGLCTNILKKYGYLLHENLRNINELDKIEITERNHRKYVSICSYENLRNIMITFDNEVKYYFNETPIVKGKFKVFNQLLSDYNHLVITQFLSENKITYNAIITLVLELFNKYPNVKAFYSKYFPFIIVDEYQDTNIINLKLLNSLINDSSQLLFMGDSMQRIFGFIGAVPNLLPISLKKYKMESIELDKNYRFKDSPLLLDLDSFMRNKYKDFSYTKKIDNIEKVIIGSPTQKEESMNIVELLSKFETEDKTAILFKQRGLNTTSIIDYLDSKDIEYFYAIFDETDTDYLEFYEKTLSTYLEKIENDTFRNYSKIIKSLLRDLTDFYHIQLEDNIIISSLYKLLEVFLLKNKSNPNLEERYEIIFDVLNNKTLKHYLNSVEETLILSTIHGAKGLEWDNVILPDVESKTYCWALCGKCNNRRLDKCFIDQEQIENNGSFKKALLDELSTFYVGITRAKKNIYFTYSDQSYRFDDLINTVPSCLLKILTTN